MPLIELPQTLCDVLLAAVADSAAHERGEKRKILRASYDLFLSQISAAIFGKSMGSRLELRRQVNDALSAPVCYSALLIEELRELLRSHDILFEHDYIERGEDLSVFASKLGAYLQVVLHGEAS